MNYLWAPWRLEYILGPKPDDCVFCISDNAENDTERLILFRGAFCFVILNRFPYNCGHLMVCPYRHVTNIEELGHDELSELMLLIQKCAAILKKSFKCEGINIGLNQGQAAGAGIRDHLHFHIVPRWNGDSSFIAVLGDVRTLPSFLEKTYEQLLPFFKNGSDNKIECVGLRRPISLE